MRKQKEVTTPNVEYYFYGKTPVMILRDQKHATVKAFQISTQRFVADFSFWSLIMFDKDNLARETNRQDFEKAVKQYGGNDAILRAAISI
jgi:NaMN:DMB phosphoribosyltransferase